MRVLVLAVALLSAPAFAYCVSNDPVCEVLEKVKDLERKADVQQDEIERLTKVTKDLEHEISMLQFKTRNLARDIESQRYTVPLRPATARKP